MVVGRLQFVLAPRLPSTISCNLYYQLILSLHLSSPLLSSPSLLLLPSPLQASNYHCNATCALLLTHHFSRQMLDKKQKGLIAFTSSSAGKARPNSA